MAFSFSRQLIVRACTLAALSIVSNASLAQISPTTEPGHLDVWTLERPRILPLADKMLADAPITVTASHSPRSAGGQHDFFSEGDYWWPDPKDPDAPYIQRDGMTNPDNFTAHREALMRMSLDVATLTAAWRVTNDTKYSDATIKHLHAWFVDPDTRMNPNLQYAQAIHGRYTGRGIGIIDTIHLIEPARSIVILEQAGVLKNDDAKAIKAWFTDYVQWLLTNKNAKEELAAKNNHGTCFTMQLAAFAALIGDEKTLDFCRDHFKTVLLPSQLAKDGSFPLELARTKPYSYSMFNLDAMCTLCQIASTPSDNLWSFTLPDGRNMHLAESYMYPFIDDKSKWPKKPDVMFWDKWPVRSPSLLFTGAAYGEQKYLDLWQKLPADYSNEEVRRNVPIRTPVLWINK